MAKTKYFKAKWRCNTPQLLQEITILNHNGSGILTRPIHLFGILLSEVADRAAELKDPQLDALMCRLALYEQADQNQKDKYNQKLTEATIKKADMIIRRKK